MAGSTDMGQAILPFAMAQRATKGDANPAFPGLSRKPREAGQGASRGPVGPPHFDPRLDNLIEQFWHSGEDVTQESPRSFLLGRRARLLLSEDATLEVGGGNGWRSRVFGSKEPAAVICAARKQALPALFAAVIDLSGEAKSLDVAQAYGLRSVP